MAHLGGIFDYEGRKERLEEVLLRLEDPGIWNDPQEAQKLGQERASLEATVTLLDNLDLRAHDAREFLELALEEGDTESIEGIEVDSLQIEAQLEKLEFLRMFSGELDSASAFVDIQAGSGGTEAQDWAEMLLRLYLRWTEQRGFSREVIDLQPGDEV